jgi:hypothetical protein
VVDGLVELQRTARPSPGGPPAAGPVALELVLVPRPGGGRAAWPYTATCTVDLTAPAAGHGVRRLVRAH